MSVFHRLDPIARQRTRSQDKIYISGGKKSNKYWAEERAHKVSKSIVQVVKSTVGVNGSEVGFVEEYRG